MINLEKVTNRPYSVAMTAILVTAIGLLWFVSGTDVKTLGCACLNCKCADCVCDGYDNCQCECCGNECEKRCEEGKCKSECEKPCE